MLPPSPSASVKASIWVLGWMLMLSPSKLMMPALPVLCVKALMSMPSLRVILGLMMSIWPALPAPLLLTVISPLPVMLRFSGAVIIILPPFPLV